MSAAQALGKMQAAEAVDALIEALNDKDDTVQLSVIQALGAIGDQRAVEPLLQFVLSCKNSHPDDRQWNAATAVCALKTLADNQVIEPLMAYLQQKSFSRTAAEEIVFLLAEFKVTQAVHTIGACITSNNVGLRASSAFALGILQEKQGIPYLINALNDKENHAYVLSSASILLVRSNRRICDEAATALGKIGDPSAIPALAAALLDDVEKAAHALVKIDPEVAIEHLIVALAKETKMTRATAVVALGETGNKRAVEPLIGVLQNDPVLEIRCLAAIALGEVGDERAVPPLIDALQSTEKAYSVFNDLLFDSEPRHLCDDAADALEKIATPEAMSAVRQWRQTQIKDGA